MRRYYHDLLALSELPPAWFDEHAVPRFCEFRPQLCANVYASEVVLALIECQNCRHEFKVAMSWASTDAILRRESMRNRVAARELEYGDPPNVGCCPSGPTMTSVTRKVLEFWAKASGVWSRQPELEVEFECDWMEDDE